MEPPSRLTTDYYLLWIILALVSVLYTLIGLYCRSLLCEKGERGLLYGSSGKEIPTSSLLQFSLICEILIIFICYKLTRDLGFLTVFLIITSFVILLKFIIPQTIQSKHNFWISNKLERVLAIGTPFTHLISQYFNRLSISLKKNKKERDAQSLEEFTEELYDDDEVDPEEKELVKDIVEFSTTKVNQIMTPRVNVIAISTYCTSSEVKLIALNSGFSRFPVYKETFDNVIGFLYIKDLVSYLQNNEEDFDWKYHIRPISFVPESKKIRNLLDDMRKNKFHLAMVADEYGGIEGIVTLEDILEEIVGEIVDETD